MDPAWLQTYRWIVENGDKRTDPWLLVYSPLPVTFIFLCYLFVLWAGPRFMKHREPVDLKAVLIVYNFTMVCWSAYMVHEFLVSSWLSGYSLLCQPVDYSDSPLAMRCLFKRVQEVSEVEVLTTPAISFLKEKTIHSILYEMAKVCWWFFFSKVIELCDTMFFILRKKNNQLTFLHVYHHGTMIVNWWLGVKYLAGGQSFLIGLVNSTVHVVMYLYYGLAAFGPHMQRYLWWKRYLTRLQLTQFVILTVHAFYNLFAECDYPDRMNALICAYLVSLIVLFSNFYIQSYLSTKKKSQA